MNSATLLDAFLIDRTTRIVALTGAGGKTSLMYALAQGARARGWAVVSTTTTKIFPPGPEQSPRLLLKEHQPLVHRVDEVLKSKGHVTVARGVLSSGKLDGLSVADVESLTGVADLVLIEADGAARRCIKAPEAWEPVIPGRTNLVIPVVGLDCLGRPATEEVVFRLRKFLEVTGLSQGDMIGPEVVASLLNHPKGALKGIPGQAKVVPFLNKEDQLVEPMDAAVLTDLILRRVAPRIQRVVTGALVGRPTVRAFDR